MSAPVTRMRRKIATLVDFAGPLDEDQVARFIGTTAERARWELESLRLWGYLRWDSKAGGRCYETTFRWSPDEDGGPHTPYRRHGDVGPR